MQRPELTDEQREILGRLEQELMTWKVPKQNRAKKSTGKGRSVAFGFIRRRSYKPDFSRYDTHKPKVWNLLKEFGKTITIPWLSVQLNEDCVCGKHKDQGNTGLSYLVSFGDYTGGELCLESADGDVKLDCRYKPLIFDGSATTHWNSEFVGKKYTIVYFYPIIPKKFEKDFEEGWNTKPEFLQHFEL